MTKEKWKLKFSKVLENRMKALNLDAKALAKRTGIELHMIYRYVDAINAPSAYYAARLAEALQCTTDELISFSALSTSEDYYGN